MPKAGVDMTEGQIVQWNKKVGEFVKEGEILLEIMTDKVSMELEAEEDGYLIAIPQRRWRNCPCNGSYRLPWRRRGKYPNSWSRSARSCQAPAAASASNDDGKSDDALISL